MVIYAAVLGVNTEIAEGFSLNVVGTMTLNQRLALLAQLVGAAMGRCRIQALTLAPEIEVRYLFVAPEYFLSAGSDAHIVTREDQQHILTSLRALSTRYPDLMLIPGTLPYYRRRRVEDVGKYPGFQHKYISHNAAYVIHDSLKAYKHNKRHDAGEVLPNENRNGKISYRGGTSNGQFNLAGVNIGLEICADHDVGVLRAELIQYVDLHIVMSASVTLKLDNFCARDGGFLIHSNAGSGHSVYQVERSWVDQSVANFADPQHGVSGRIQPFENYNARAFRAFQDHLPRFEEITSERQRVMRKESVKQQKRARARYINQGHDPGPTIGEFRNQLRQRDANRLGLLMNQVGGSMGLYQLDLNVAPQNGINIFD